MTILSAFAYPIYGIYYFLTDKSVYSTVWSTVQKSLFLGLNTSLLWGYVTYGFQKWYVQKLIRKFLKDGSSWEFLLVRRILGVDLPTFATWTLILSQSTLIINLVLSRSLRKAKARVFDITLERNIKGSNTDDASSKSLVTFFGPYVEESKNPPNKHRIKQIQWHQRALRHGGLPIFRMILRRLASLSEFVIPILGTIVVNFVYALPKATGLHTRFFELKKMPQGSIEQATWIAEREWEYKAFGLTAGILESLPIFGNFFFSITNQVGAALWALQFEERQINMRQKLDIKDKDQVKNSIQDI